MKSCKKCLFKVRPYQEIKTFQKLLNVTNFWSLKMYYYFMAQILFV